MNISSVNNHNPFLFQEQNNNLSTTQLYDKLELNAAEHDQSNEIAQKGAQINKQLEEQIK